MDLTKIPQGSGRAGVEIKLNDSAGDPINPNDYGEVRVNVIDVTGEVRTKYKNPTADGFEPITLNADGIKLDILAKETSAYQVGVISVDIWLDDSTDVTPLAFPRTSLAQVTKSTI